MSTKIEWCDQTWNPVPNYQEYYASKDGQIMSMKYKHPKILKQITSKDGHKYVFFYKNGLMKKCWVHHAVLFAFGYIPKTKQECRHLDGNPQNNNLLNLKWGTRLENVKDKIKHQTQPCGEKAITHKLSEEQVLEIRKNYGKHTLRFMANLYGVSHTCIRRAALGIKWAHLERVN